MELLVIKTDLKELDWLKYILEEFKRINKAKFDIMIKSINDSKKYQNEIYYTNEPMGINSLYNSQMKTPAGDIVYIDNKGLYVLKDTVSNKNFSIEYDILWNAFVFLSRLEEHYKPTLSYSSKHIRKDKKSFYIPIVNILFNNLEDFLKEKLNLPFENKAKPIIDLSHDVDYIKKTWQLRLKQSALHLYNLRFSKFLKFLFSNPSYWCFDFWANLEKEYNRRSIFYIYAKSDKKGLKQELLDPSYDITSNKKLQEQLKKLLKEGFEIGLHGSYKSAVDFDLLKKEKEKLENILDVEIKKVRQHWLNYDENITPYLHEKLFKYDSTLGWNNQMGFRSGIASLYIPYNFKEKRAFNYFEIPQIIMDSNIFEYKERKEIVFNVLKRAIDIPKAPYFSISWHQRVCNSDYTWSNFYEKIIRFLLNFT